MRGVRRKTHSLASIGGRMITTGAAAARFGSVCLIWYEEALGGREAEPDHQPTNKCGFATVSHKIDRFRNCKGMALRESDESVMSLQ
jgi:hypothetical protein